MKHSAITIDFRIAAMGIRVLVTVIIVQVCLLNFRSIAAWPVVAAVSRLVADADAGLTGQSRTANWAAPGGVKRSTSEDWSQLVLTLQWPQTFCLNYNDTHNGSDKCVVPSSVNDWTIHGLWPSNADSEGPANCNNSWTFDKNNITDLEAEMNDEWPDFLISSSYYSLWEHEWKKHGTCAASLPALYGEHNYFKMTLDLRKRYDVFSILKKEGVSPTMEMSYSYGKIFNAVHKGVGKNATITCIYDKKTKLVYLSEVEFCLDKEFTLIDCAAGKSGRPSKLRDEDCAHDQLIFYPPKK